MKDLELGGWDWSIRRNLWIERGIGMARGFQTTGYHFTIFLQSFYDRRDLSFIFG